MSNTIIYCNKLSFCGTFGVHKVKHIPKVPLRYLTRCLSFLQSSSSGYETLLLRNGTAGAKSGLVLLSMYTNGATILWNFCFFPGLKFSIIFPISYSFAVSGVDIILFLDESSKFYNFMYIMSQGNANLLFYWKKSKSMPRYFRALLESVCLWSSVDSNQPLGTFSYRSFKYTNISDTTLASLCEITSHLHASW